MTTGAHCAPLLIGKLQIGKIANAQRDFIIEELNLRFIVVERMELTTKMKSMFITHEHPNTKDENARKFLGPKLITASDWSIDNLDQKLVKIDHERSVGLSKEKEKFKKSSELFSRKEL